MKALFFSRLVVAIAKEARVPCLGALFLSAFGVSLRRQEEKASGTAKAALQAWYKNHVKPSCGNKKKKALLLLLVKPSRDTQYCHPKKALRGF